MKKIILLLCMVLTYTLCFSVQVKADDENEEVNTGYLAPDGQFYKYYYRADLKDGYTVAFSNYKIAVYNTGRENEAVFYDGVNLNPIICGNHDHYCTSNSNNEIWCGYFYNGNIFECNYQLYKSSNENYVSHNMLEFENRDELIEWLLAPDIAPLSEAIYLDDIGHIVGLDKGFKRYTISDSRGVETDYLELGWISETSGGIELLDSYYDEAMIEIKIAPGVSVRNALTKKIVYSFNPTQKFLYDIRQASMIGSYDWYDDFTNLRINVTSLLYLGDGEHDGLLHDWWSDILDQISLLDLMIYDVDIDLDIYLTPYIFVEGDVFCGDTAKITIPSPNKDGSGKVTVEFGTITSSQDGSGNTIETFNSISERINTNYTPGEGKTYTEAIVSYSNDIEGSNVTLDNWNGTISTFVSGIGQVPAFFATVFAFLPLYILRMIEITIGAICILRIVGR